MHPRFIHIADFDYNLPEEKIATHPVPNRDESKLLVFKNNHITDAQFHQLGNFLDEDTMLIGNNTRVIPARLFFKKESGATIEIFCLEPLGKSHQDAMIETGQSTWQCLVGGAKKWKGDDPLTLITSNSQKNLTVFARKIEKLDDQFIIAFQWDNAAISFSEILDSAGELPLPPYFNRSAEEEDYQRYQTVFARMKGSVAAPTAGLHFTDSMFQNLASRGIHKLELTLHVGAGTFKPVSSSNMEGHAMHSEKFSVTLELMEQLINHYDKKIITIGTTTTRALESLYWLGIRWMNGQKHDSGIDQWEPYEKPVTEKPLDVLKYLYATAQELGLRDIQTETSILIAPGYQFKFVDGIITNFHMPKSTLLLLIAAVTGKVHLSGQYNWRHIYDHALQHHYRFLSYGDSSLLFADQHHTSR